VPKADIRTAAVFLFDHLVGAGEHRGRDGNTHRLRRLGADDQLELVRLDDGEVRRLRTFQKPSDLVSREGIKVRNGDAIARKASGFHHIAELADRWDVRREAQLPKVAPKAVHWRGNDIHTFGSTRPECLKGRHMYRQRAANAKDRAAQAKNPSIKSAFEQVAADWIALAEQVERIDRGKSSVPRRKK